MLVKRACPYMLHSQDTGMLFTNLTEEASKNVHASSSKENTETCTCFGICNKDYFPELGIWFLSHFLKGAGITTPPLQVPESTTKTHSPSNYSLQGRKITTKRDGLSLPINLK